MPRNQPIDRIVTGRFSCVVCGAESRRHGGWFLVAENRWLDRVKILAWHPLVARQPRMQSVCGKDHLRTLLTHWLTYANLQFLASAAHGQTGPDSTDPCDSESVHRGLGRIVGELAVHRESLSRVWTGSPETLECILSALVGNVKHYPQPEKPAPVPFSGDQTREAYPLN